MGAGGGILIVSDRGGGNERVIPHSGARLSWVLSQAGNFSALVPTTLAQAFDFAGGNAAGAMWVKYIHACLPNWGGVITVPSWQPGTFELAAESFHVLMRRRRVPRLYGQQEATPGALASRAYHDVVADDPMLITDFQADEWGDPVSWEWKGGDLHDDILRQLASASGQEWTVDADRNAQWRTRLGEDKTGSVMLHYPHEIVDYIHTTDLWTAENDIEGTGTNANYKRSWVYTREHIDSIKQIGRYQTSRRYERVIKGMSLAREVASDVAKNAWPAETLDLTTVNVGQSWSRYDLGDSIGITIPDANLRTTVRIISRSVDIDTQTERLGVEVEHVADGW